ncbi:hypothetical protein BX265_6171 [Streptomyces sp. TLI_235]|nr:hypothetical protein [Streptomyces sp. TLI_235]PBC71561.1 hypothetical protein BX265_6171 [Streptomyces sp. TLI_235]
MTDTTRYQWIITGDHNGRQATAEGTIDLAPGSSRRDAYNTVRNYMAQRFGAPDVIVLFFDLQPETLP